MPIGTGYSNTLNGYQVPLASLVLDPTVNDGNTATGPERISSPPAQVTAAVVLSQLYLISQIVNVWGYAWNTTHIIEYSVDGGNTWLPITTAEPAGHGGTFGLNTETLSGLSVVANAFRLSVADDGNMGATDGHISVRELDLTGVPYDTWIQHTADYFPRASDAQQRWRQQPQQSFVPLPHPTVATVSAKFYPTYPDRLPPPTYRQFDGVPFLFKPAAVTTALVGLPWNPIAPDFLLRPLALQNLFTALYGLSVLPPKPTPGSGANPGGVGPPSPVPTDFTKLLGVVVAAPQGMKSLPYLIRADDNQIAILDSNSSKPVDFAVYQCHTFTGGEQNRDTRKKVVRILVFGEGHIPTEPYHAYMVVTADKSRSNVYVYSAQSADPRQGLLWSQNTLALTGRTIDVVLFIAGASGVVIRDIQLQFTIVG